MKHSKLKLAALVAFLAAGQGVMAHTRLLTSTTPEGVSVLTNANIGHGCEENPVIANSVVFPDGLDSKIIINGKRNKDAKLEDYLTGWLGRGTSHVLSKDVFAKSAPKIGRTIQTDPNDPNSIIGGNVVGNHSWEGNIPPEHTSGLVPFRIGGAAINPESCVTSVKFIVAIADICKITSIAGFNTQSVNLWTPAIGSKFDGVGLPTYNLPANFTITRDLTLNPLPPSCDSAGLEVTVFPSRKQLNRDLRIPGVWPLGN
jgi:hypothetical protein